MDIKNLLSETKARFNHNLAKSYLKEKYENSLIFADQGGLWKATPEFLAQLTITNEDTLILVDSYDAPIKVDKNTLFNKAHTIYMDATEQYYDEWVELKKQR